jgi:hypothetical protein
MARLKLTRPLDPWTARLPAPKARPPAPCPRGVRLQALMARPANVVTLRPEELANELEAGMAYCVRMCGGCALTEGWTPE